MDTIIENFVKIFFYTQKDIFGEKSSFLKFKATNVVTLMVGINSQTIFGNIEYEIKGEIRTSESFCLKLMPNVVNFEASNSYSFMNEMYFYSKLLPSLASTHSNQDLFPKYFDGFLKLNGKEESAILILKNLQSDGYTGAKQPIFLNFEHLSLMMRTLGKFHGLSYKMKSSDPNRFYSLAMSCSPTIFSVITNAKNVILKHGMQALQLLQKDPLYSGKLSNFEKIIENPQTFLIDGMKKYMDHQFSVFCHFNYRRENVLFRYENDIPVAVKILDMAYIGLGSPWTDIALVLYMNADQQMRDEHWDDLLDEYFKGCSEVCSSEHMPTKDQIKKEMCASNVVYGIFFSICTIPLLIAKEKETANNNHQSDDKSTKLNGQMDANMNLTGTDYFLDICKDALNRGSL